MSQMAGTPSIGDRMRSAGEAPAAFDYMRVILAVSVIVWHSVYVCYGIEAEAPFYSGWMRPFIYAVLPAFFSLGGFLIAGSLLRNTLPAFLALRAARIFPALISVVLIAALVVGPLVTSLPLAHYVADREFATYLLGVVGWIHYHLPGVFTDNPAGPDVNTQLWTIPFEFKFYAITVVFALLGMTRRKVWLFPAALLLLGFAVTRDVLTLPLVERPPGRMLVLCSVWGLILYLWRDRVPHSRALFIASLVAALGLMSFRATPSLAALPVAYAVVWVGVHNPARRFPVRGTDYSYGLYVYGFPIQQILAHVAPGARVWWMNAGLAVVLAWMAAMLSWHLVEKPVLRRKRQIVAAANGAVAGLQQFGSRAGLGRRAVGEGAAE